MAVNPQLIIAGVSLMATVARSQALTQGQSSKSAIEIERLRLEAHSFDTQKTHEKDILLRMIDAAENMYSQKIDAVVEMFSQAREILLNHQRILSEEKQRLNEQTTTGEVSEQRFILINKRHREIDSELTEINVAVEEMRNRATAVVAAIEPSLSNASIAKKVKQLTG